MNEEHQHLLKDCSYIMDDEQRKTIEQFIRRSFRRGVSRAQIAALLNDVSDQKVSNSNTAPITSNGTRKLSSRTRLLSCKSDDLSLFGSGQISQADDSISVLTSPRSVSGRKRRNVRNVQQARVKNAFIAANNITKTPHESVPDFHEISEDSDVAQDSEKILASWLTTIPTVKPSSCNSQTIDDRSLHVRSSESQRTTIDKEKVAGSDTSDNNLCLFPINTIDHKQTHQIDHRQEPSSHRRLSISKSTSRTIQPSCHVRESDLEGQSLNPK